MYNIYYEIEVFLIGGGMRLEERLNKKLKDINFNDISALGESIAEIDESDILEWTRIHQIKKPNMYEHYKYNCVRYRVRDLCKRFFKMRPRFEGLELEILFDLKSMVAVKKLLNMLVNEGYLEDLGNGQYQVIKTDEYVFVEICVSVVWKNGMENIDFQNQQLENVLKSQLTYKYIHDARFLKDVMKIFKDYCGDLISKSLDERAEFFRIHLFNTSRGYMIKLMLLKYVYRDMIEGMDYFIDTYWCKKLKNTFFNWKGEYEK